MFGLCFCPNGNEDFCFSTIVGLLAEMQPKSDTEIREGMSGNLCRCGAYHHIVAAVREVVENTENAPI